MVRFWSRIINSQFVFYVLYNKLSVRVLSGIKHSTIASCLYTCLIKHSCSFIIQYIKYYTVHSILLILAPPPPRPIWFEIKWDNILLSEGWFPVLRFFDLRIRTGCSEHANSFIDAYWAYVRKKKHWKSALSEGEYQYFLEMLMYHEYHSVVFLLCASKHPEISLNMILPWHFNNKKIFNQNRRKCVSGVSEIR